MHAVTLAHPAHLDGFRAAVRAARALGLAPGAIAWGTVDAPALGAPLPPADEAPPPRVPRAFVALAERVICHADPARFALLHEAVLRLQEAPKLLADRANPLVDRLEGMAKAVGRDVHKMRAFVRFREVATPEGPHFIAWFEPEHHIVRLNSGFFIRRFASQRWTILTPAESAHWDGTALHWLPGASRADAPGEDPVEAIWQTYYASIFNPARLKVRAMQSEMPKKYWRNLPEAALIPELIASAEGRTAAMIEQGAGAADRPLADNLAALAEAAGACTRCPLHAPATQTVFGAGPADARLMIVGEQPGDQEDLAGRPFVGPAGRLLDRALVEAGIDRARVYVTNAVKHFKYEWRGKRRIHSAPNAGEIDACRWWLDQERALLQPALVLMLGASAGRALMARAVTVGRERGRLLALPDGRPGFLTVHPSYLLRIDNEAARQAEYGRFVAELAEARVQAGA